MLPDGFLINAADATGPDTACVALTDLDAGDPYTILLTHGAAPAPRWARVDVRRVIVSMTTLTLPGQDAPSFAALSDEGDVYFLGEDEVPVEKVPGMGVHSADATGRGAATLIRNTDRGLMVLGNQGQVFLRAGPGDWRSLAPTPPVPDVAGDILSPTCAVWQTDRRLLAGGVVYPVQPDSSRAMEALSAGDFALYAQLKVSTARTQYGDLAILEDGTWRRLDLPGNAPLFALYAQPAAGRVLVAGKRGTLYDYRGDSEIGVVPFPETSETLGAIVPADGALVIAGESVLFRGTPEDGFGPMPTPGVTLASVFHLAPFGETLWAFGSEAFYRRNAGSWSRIDIPPGVVEIEGR